MEITESNGSRPPRQAHHYATIDHCPPWVRQPFNARHDQSDPEDEAPGDHQSFLRGVKESHRIKRRKHGMEPPSFGAILDWSAEGVSAADDHGRELPLEALVALSVSHENAPQPG